MLAILLLATGCSDSYCPSLDKVVTVEESDFYEISLSGLKPREIDLAKETFSPRDEDRKNCYFHYSEVL